MVPIYQLVQLTATYDAPAGLISNTPDSEEYILQLTKSMRIL